MTTDNTTPVWKESDRLAALERYKIFDTARETMYDEIVQLAAELLGAPIALINLVADERQWFKAEVGLGVSETPLESSICAHTILESEAMVIPDTTKDPRFDCNPLVTGQPGIRFYAGAPLKTPEGLPLGALCVLDTKPRPEGLSTQEHFFLKTLAKQVMAQLELRRAILERDAALAQQYRQEVFQQQIQDSAIDYVIVSTDLQGRVKTWNAGAENVLGWAKNEAIGAQLSICFTPEDNAIGQSEYEMQLALETGRAPDERWHVKKDGSLFFASGAITPLRDEAGIVEGFVKVLRDQTQRHLQKERLQVTEERLQYALEGAGDGVWDWNVQTNEVFYSARWKEMLGYGAHEEPGSNYSTWANLVHADDLPSTVNLLQACLRGIEPCYVDEFRMWHQSSQWTWIRARGRVVARSTDATPLRMVGTITDITETKALHYKLEKSHDLLTRLTQQVPGVLYQFQLHADGRFSCPYISGMVEEIFELSALEIQTNVRLVHELIYGDDQEAYYRAIAQSAATLQPWLQEVRLQLPRQGLCWRETNAKPVRMQDGSILWHGFATDISERKRTEQTIKEFNQALAQQANYDTLTGLPNRRLFRDRLDQEIKHSASTNQTIALLFLDLDRFKEVNDLLGHDAGDLLLKEAAQRIQKCLNQVDTVARLGGDEFTIILTEVTEAQHVEQVAQQILDVLAEPFAIGDKTVRVSGSIGITVCPTDALLPEDLIRNADQAMYLAKGSGRNQLSFFKQSMQEEAISRLNLIRELREALPKKQFELYFQPIIDMDSGAIIKAEALLRWHHPSRGLLLPTDFISIAEDTGLIHAIGNWAFQEAAASSKRWSTRLGQPFQISINKSPVQFLPHQDANMTNWIAYLARLGLTKHNISIEITEGLLLNMSSQVLEKLDALQKGGIEVSIDDFGTGYSSLTYLKKLDVDYLKIDQSFVRDMLHDANTATIVETVIMMANKLGLEVIAEGVETAEQCNWLKTQGCHYAQGFYFSEPVPAPAFEQQLFGIIPDQHSIVSGNFK